MGRDVAADLFRNPDHELSIMTNGRTIFVFAGDLNHQTGTRGDLDGDRHAGDELLSRYSIRDYFFFAGGGNQHVPASFRCACGIELHHVTARFQGPGSAYPSSIRWAFE